MFWAPTRLGKVCICPFDAWILIAVAELSREASVGVAVALCAFGCALAAVWIIL
jgi:hypothetical protein